jgi:hypothetical protein
MLTSHDSGWQAIGGLRLAVGGVETCAFLGAAWLLEKDSWRGAALAIVLFLFRSVVTATQVSWRPAFALLLPLVSLAFAIASLRLLRRHKVS